MKRDELASYHVGRKMRFTRADVQNYVARSRRQKAWGQHGASANLAVPDLGQAGEAAALAAAQPAAAAHTAAATAASATHALAGATASQRAASAHAEAAGSYVIAGNDIVGDMLANYLGMVDVPIKRVYEGSYRALSELYFGRVQAALTHIYDGVAGQYNVTSVQKLAPGMPLQVVRLARRRQGLVATPWKNDPNGQLATKVSKNGQGKLTRCCACDGAGSLFGEAKDAIKGRTIPKMQASEKEAPCAKKHAPVTSTPTRNDPSTRMNARRAPTLERRTPHMVSSTPDDAPISSAPAIAAGAAGANWSGRLAAPAMPAARASAAVGW